VEIIGILIIVLAVLGALPTGLALLFRKGKRLLGVKIMLVGLIGFVAGAFLGAHGADQQAREAGWMSASDRRAANEAGFSDPKLWHAKLEADRLVAEAKAEQERAAAAQEAARVKAEQEAKALGILKACEKLLKATADVIDGNVSDCITVVRRIDEARQQALAEEPQTTLEGSDSKVGEHTVTDHGGVKVWKPSSDGSPSVETRVVIPPAPNPPMPALGVNEGWQLKDTWYGSRRRERHWHFHFGGRRRRW
jgi:hypothetical protein